MRLYRTGRGNALDDAHDAAKESASVEQALDNIQTVIDKERTATGG